MTIPGPEIAGMMWINEADYEFAAYWFSEARNSPMFLNAGAVLNRRKLIGNHILIAHRKAIVDYSNGPQGWVDSETKQAYTNIKYFPGIFALAQVTDLQYVIGSRKPDKKMKVFYLRLQNDGHSLVNVIRDAELEQNSFDESLKFTR